MKEKIARAYQDAMTAHQSQKRKYSEIPYIIHPIEVYELLKLVTDDEDVLCAGLLHDVHEDNPEKFSLGYLKGNYGSRVTSIIKEVSKDPKTREFHIHTREGLMVKLADMLHNISDCPDSDYVTGKIQFINEKIIWKTD